MITTLSLLLWVAAEILVGLVLSFLPWSRIADWFLNREAAIKANNNQLQVTLHEKLKDGKHRVVYGIFDQATSKFSEGESIIADEIDPEIAEFHKDSPLVVYT